MAFIIEDILKLRTLTIRIFTLVTSALKFMFYHKNLILI